MRQDRRRPASSRSGPCSLPSGEANAVAEHYGAAASVARPNGSPYHLRATTAKLPTGITPGQCRARPKGGNPGTAGERLPAL
eukprot:7962143-Heterocapsa_arctica.AAC.1